MKVELYVTVLAWIIVVGLPIYTTLQILKTKYSPEYIICKEEIDDAIAKTIGKRVLLWVPAIVWLIII